MEEDDYKIALFEDIDIFTMADWVVMRDENSTCRKAGKPEPHSAEKLDKYDRICVLVGEEKYDEAVAAYVDLFPEGWYIGEKRLADLQRYADERGLNLPRLKTLIPIVYAPDETGKMQMYIIGTTTDDDEETN